jgi:hypothetical protein
MKALNNNNRVLKVAVKNRALIKKIKNSRILKAFNRVKRQKVTIAVT